MVDRLDPLGALGAIQEDTVHQYGILRLDDFRVPAVQHRHQPEVHLWMGQSDRRPTVRQDDCREIPGIVDHAELFPSLNLPFPAFVRQFAPVNKVFIRDADLFRLVAVLKTTTRPETTPQKSERGRGRKKWGKYG